MEKNPFTEGEVLGRIAKLRTEIGKRDLDAAVFASPENVFYLTGLDHWGYFSPHLLIVPLHGRPVLVTREMERVTIEKQVTTAEFRGHSDSETAADRVALALAEHGLAGKRIGLEYFAGGLSHGLALRLQARVDAKWSDISGLIDRMRLIKSAEEQALMRRAARVTDAAAKAAIGALADGACETRVAAECSAAMILAGGHIPGFGPFIRPGSRLGEEHATWGTGVYRSGETVFLELSGCVSRYHAPLGRLVRIGGISDEDAMMATVCQRAFDAVVAALTPGSKARDIYAAWQDVVDKAGLADYRRHHCGYAVGIGQPPSWTGGNSVTGLKHDSSLEIDTGMSFHVLSWLMSTGMGDDFMSNTVLLTGHGAEVLNRTATGPIIR